MRRTAPRARPRSRCLQTPAQNVPHSGRYAQSNSRSSIFGGDVTESLAQLAIDRGGRMRVGLEDYAGPGQPRHEELVAEAVEMARRSGRPVATPGRVAEILAVPPSVADAWIFL